MLWFQIEVFRCWLNVVAMYCEMHLFATGLLHDGESALFVQNECTCLNCRKKLSQTNGLLYWCHVGPITMIPKQWMQMTKYIGLLFFMNFFLSALKRQNDKHTSVHPPLSTTVPLCGSYGKSNFTPHGLCRLLSLSPTKFFYEDIVILLTSKYSSVSHSMHRQT